MPIPSASSRKQQAPVGLPKKLLRNFLSPVLASPVIGES